MSSDVFPPLPGFARELDRNPDYPTDLHEAISGREQSMSWSSVGRTSFGVRWNWLRSTVNAPAPWAAYTEIGVVLRFYDAHRGDWDSFLWVDPYTNTQRRVRFVRGSLRVRRRSGGAGGAQLWIAEANWRTALP